MNEVLILSPNQAIGATAILSIDKQDNELPTPINESVGFNLSGPQRVVGKKRASFTAMK
ncbi:hypothetical protein [Larkinella harenae]